MKTTRRVSLLLLVTLLCTSLASCVGLWPTKPWTEGMLAETFFDAEYLAERGVADLPLPKMDGAYYDPEEELLYLNLTRTEFDEYSQAVAEYLRGNDELKIKGFLCGYDIYALLVIPITVFQLAPLDVDHIGGTERLFGFSTVEPEASYSDEIEVVDPKFVSLKWDAGVKPKGASYTAIMSFPDYLKAEYLPCYHGHDFEDMNYPVAGSVLSTTIRTCTRCHHEERAGFGYGDELEKFTISITEGEQFISSDAPTEAYRGDVVEIKRALLIDADIMLTANGTLIPPRTTEDGRLVFSFIMPDGDVSIVVEEVIDENLPKD